jgi:hypothetical protein
VSLQPDEKSGGYTVRTGLSVPRIP